MAAPPLQAYFDAMHAHFAREINLDRWWPARTRFEMIVGALLVQNTAWTNVTRAIARLRSAGKLSPAGIRSLSKSELGLLIRSSGTWRLKARRLRALVAWLDRHYASSLPRLLRQPAGQLRAELLSLDGVGEETADAILLYAAGYAGFVMDAYARRIFARHALPADRPWAAAQFPQPRRARHMHALVVETAKRYCRKAAPDCAHCPLQPFLPQAALA